MEQYKPSIPCHSEYLSTVNTVVEFDTRVTDKYTGWTKSVIIPFFHKKRLSAVGRRGEKGFEG
jgi:hypothetical protein